MSAMMATTISAAERSNNNNSLDHSISHPHDSMGEENEMITYGDFVPPPSSWFESAPSSTTIDESCTPGAIDDGCNASDSDHFNRDVVVSPSKNKEHTTDGFIGTTNTNDESEGITQDLTPSPTKFTQQPSQDTIDQRIHTQTAANHPPQKEIFIPRTTLPPPSSSPTIPSGGDAIVGHTRPSPSWREISSQVLPAAARELLSSSMRRLYYTARLSYAKGRWHRKYSDIGHNAGGFFISSSSNLELPPHLSDLPPFSSLPWVDRQLVQEWRTYLPETPDCAAENEDFDFDQARTLVPKQIPRPVWKKADVCHSCHKPFGPVRLRHHCRSCGNSFCQEHSTSIHRLPHLGYDDVPERVCDSCKRVLEEQNLAERVAWRLARCRDYNEGHLTPYFETGLDSVEEVAIRVTKVAIAMAKSIPLGAQATVAVETVDVLRKYGLHGIYGIMLRQEFLAAADLLRKALGINKMSWPLSVHELSAAIFYALAQHRAMRGLSPEREHSIHRFRGTTHGNRDGAGARTPSPDGDDSTNLPGMVDKYELSALDFHNTSVVDETDTYNPIDANFVKLDADLHGPSKSCDPRRRSLYSPNAEEKLSNNEDAERDLTTNSPLPTFDPVCDPVPDTVLGSIVFYAPIALNFIYATKEVEMQLLAAQQGWRLLYAFLNQELGSMKPCDRPASAIFVHPKHKIVCLSVRGTATINDVITDIRQTPVPFPNMDSDHAENDDGDWTSVDRGQGLALCGMASAAYNLFSEHIDSLLHFAKQGYRIRLVGHSLGGGVATMVGVLVLKYLEQLGYSNESNVSASDDITLLKVYAYGTPSCFDAKLAKSVDPFVTTVVLHDDVFPRLTPTSCRGLLKHLLYIRETWVEEHIEEDLRAVGERAKTAWAPRFRQNFALQSSTTSIKKYCKRQILRGKSKLMPVRENPRNVPSRDEFSDCTEIESLASDPSDWGEKFFVPTTNLSMTSSCDDSEKDEAYSDANESEDDPHPQLLLEFLGGGDNRRDGMIIDGDEFFEPEENLVGEDVDVSESVGDEYFSDAIGELPDEKSLQTSDSWSLDMHGHDLSPQRNKSSFENDNDSDPAAVVLDETPLPRMFLPGKIIHIYSHRGVYKAAYVPRTFKELRRISLAGNMLANHTTKSYFESLLEVQTVRHAPESPPRWTAYDEDNTCCCCANKFTWASTSNSEAQEARDKHNCRSCGGLICDPCSKNRVPIPSIGLTVPVRVCDRCYNDIMGGVSAASSSMTSSVMAADEDDPQTSNCINSGAREEEAEKPERMRQKRSVIVDGLVFQMRSSALS